MTLSKSAQMYKRFNKLVTPTSVAGALAVGLLVLDPPMLLAVAGTCAFWPMIKQLRK